MTCIALLADIHGNLPALEAVINELETLQPDLVVLNGDLINAVPFSCQVVDRVRSTDWLAIRGNHEFYYLDWGTERAIPGSEDPERWGQLHWLISQIKPAQGQYLATLPDERTLYLPGTEPLRFAHGVPGRNRVGFYNEQAQEKIAAEIEPILERTFVSAHTHVQIDRFIEQRPSFDNTLQSDPHVDPHVQHGDGTQPVDRRWHLINPGSVGLPLNGDPRAQFAMLESVSTDEVWGGWRATHHRINYDRRPALRSYEETGMLEAGGIISKLFYWELVTAEAELIYYFRWAYERGLDPEDNSRDTFAAYIEATGREQYVRALDPLEGGATQ